NMFSWDMGLFKKIPLGTERVNMQFRAEFFNIFNHAMFNNPATNLSDANYGRIVATLGNAGSTQGDITSGGPRIIQLALKKSFYPPPPSPAGTLCPRGRAFRRFCAVLVQTRPF